MNKLKIGDKLPAFSLLNQDGETINIVDYIGNPIVIFFYPKDDTPGCTIEACSFRDDYQHFMKSGASVFGISSDSEESHMKFRRKHQLPYDLLSDSKGRVRKMFGVPSGFLGLLPGRVTYIIDDQGIVTHIFNDQFNVKKHVKEAIKSIKPIKV